MPARAALLLSIAAAAAAGAAAPVFAVDGEGDGIAAPLDGLAGDPSRGRAIVMDRQKSLCLLCHAGPFPDAHLQGTVAPSLAGAGSRQSAAALRLRLVDPRRLNPDTTMPAYFRSDGLQRVGAAWRGRTLFSAQELEDVVAFLVTLQDR